MKEYKARGRSRGMAEHALAGQFIAPHRKPRPRGPAHVEPGAKVKGLGVRNATVAALRSHTAYGGPKRGGARYGPPPISGRSDGHQLAPMGDARRWRNYTAQNRGRPLTPRQVRALGGPVVLAWLLKTMERTA